MYLKCVDIMKIFLGHMPFYDFLALNMPSNKVD